MLAEIITIGDEILIGQIVDTNSAWMGQQLNLAGISVKQITSVSDSKQHIIDALNEARKRADIILITGGLGPTKDDITKHTLAEYFQSKFRFDEQVYKDVEGMFAARGLPTTELNRKQAEVPEKCIVIRNKNGTAPGMWFEDAGKVFVSMPGVPYEMKGIMSDYVIPQLKTKFKLPYIVHQTVLTQGIGESFLAQIIESWEDSLAEHKIKLAYLPAASSVRLRLSVSGNDESKLLAIVNKKVEELKLLIPQYIYGYEAYGEEPDTLQKIIGEILIKKKKTLSLAESCTGGYISYLITSIAGASEYYKGSMVSYSNDIKINELGVAPSVIEKQGAVSEETVLAMAQGALRKYMSDYAIAVSGVAGPTGGTPDKPVGTVWIAIATPEKVFAQKHLFGNNRLRNIERTAVTALNMLRKELTNE